MLVIGLVLGPSVMVVSTTIILLHAKVSSFYDVLLLLFTCKQCCLQRCGKKSISPIIGDFCHISHVSHPILTKFEVHIRTY